jgi:hypothetical protein
MCKRRQCKKGKEMMRSDLRGDAEKGETLIELVTVMAIVARERHSSANVR